MESKVIDMHIHVGDKRSEMEALDRMTRSQQMVINYIIGFLIGKTPESRFFDRFDISLVQEGSYMQVSVLHLSTRDDERLVVALEEGLPDFSFEFWGRKSALKFAFNEPQLDD